MVRGLHGEKITWGGNYMMRGLHAGGLYAGGTIW